MHSVRLPRESRVLKSLRPGLKSLRHSVAGEAGLGHLHSGQQRLFGAILEGTFHTQLSLRFMESGRVIAHPSPGQPGSQSCCQEISSPGANPFPDRRGCEQPSSHLNGKTTPVSLGRKPQLVNRGFPCGSKQPKSWLHRFTHCTTTRTRSQMLSQCRGRPSPGECHAVESLITVHRFAPHRKELSARMRNSCGGRVEWSRGGDSNIHS